MIPLRRLKSCTLYKKTYTKQPNGIEIESYTSIGLYKVNIQTLSDQVSASIYGSKLNRMRRIISPYSTMENSLISKFNTSTDNVSLYVVDIDGAKYKITSVSLSGIDIELL